MLDQRVRAVGSHHQKFMVIRRPRRPEADIACLGGIDLFTSRCDDHAHHGDHQVQSSIARVYGPRPAWHDAHLEIRGPAVAEVEHCFRERWGDSTSLRRAPYSWLNKRYPNNQHKTVALPNPRPQVMDLRLRAHCGGR